MNYEFFLSKEDHRSYSLLKYLEASSNLSESISNVQEKVVAIDISLEKNDR